jgi:regulator of protease activity HflC (stomatin/prohibitin superfamily)
MSDQYGQQPPIDISKFKPLIIIGGIIIFFLMFGSKMTVTINSGEAGVLFKTFDNGVYMEQPYGEGFHFIAPWNKMYVYEVRQQEMNDKMTVLSSNGLEITVDVSMWFNPDYAKLP